MLKDQPDQHHEVQPGWVSLRAAAAQIEEVRIGFIEDLEYLVASVLPGSYRVSFDDVAPGKFAISGPALRRPFTFDSIRTLPPPPPPIGYGLTEEQFAADTEIRRCIKSAFFTANHVLLDLVAAKTLRVHARKGEVDANFETVPTDVWGVAAKKLNWQSGSAELPSGKVLFNVHFERLLAAASKSDGLLPQEAEFVAWFAECIRASQHRKTMKISEGEGSDVYTKARQLGVKKGQVEKLKRIAFDQFDPATVAIWRQSGPPAGSP